jgi:hypothetical protein
MSTYDVEIGPTSTYDIVFGPASTYDVEVGPTSTYDTVFGTTSTIISYLDLHLPMILIVPQLHLPLYPIWTCIYL